jgi:hypothetical protein
MFADGGRRDRRPRLDDKMRELLAACTSEAKCTPVCEELNTRERRGDGISKCTVTTQGEDRAKVEFSAYHRCAGRRPTEFALAHADALRSVADWIANQGALEAASVHAFAELADELRSHNAPAELIEACEPPRATKRATRGCAALTTRGRHARHARRARSKRSRSRET